MTKKKEITISSTRKKTIIQTGRLKSEIRTLKGELKEKEYIIKILDDELNLITKLYKEEASIIPYDPELFKDKNEICPIFNIADPHIEKHIDPTKVMHLNSYNVDIAKKRFSLATNRTIVEINNLKRDYKIKRVVLNFLGDNINGYIHDELKKTNEMPPIPAARLATELIVNFIKNIADHIPQDINILVICIAGNHSRLTEKKSYSLRLEQSLEYWMYLDIVKEFHERFVGYNNINIYIPTTEISQVNIGDFIITSSHGDHFNYRGGVGGLEIPMKTWDLKIQRTIPAHRRYIGHWHTFTNSRKVLVTPSLCGYDEFALGHGFEWEPAAITMDILHSKQGFIDTKLLIVQ